MRLASVIPGVALVLAVIALLVSACSRDEAPVIAELPALSRPLLTLAEVSASPSAVMVPRNSVVIRGGATGVFVLQDNQARFRLIRLGKSVGSQKQVLSGLHGDETLIVGNLSDVHDGSPISEQ